MSSVTFADFDRVQFRLAQAEDQIKRLLARVAALEGGEPLAPEPKIEIVPTIAAPAPEPVPQIQEKPVAVVELDVMSGMGLTAGPLRR
jgi:hypothetical protein